jgi:hypothetical protein
MLRRREGEKQAEEDEEKSAGHGIFLFQVNYDRADSARPGAPGYIRKIYHLPWDLQEALKFKAAELAFPALAA